MGVGTARGSRFMWADGIVSSIFKALLMSKSTTNRGGSDSVCSVPKIVLWVPLETLEDTEHVERDFAEADLIEAVPHDEDFCQYELFARTTATADWRFFDRGAVELCETVSDDYWCGVTAENCTDIVGINKVANFLHDSAPIHMLFKSTCGIIFVNETRKLLRGL